MSTSRKSLATALTLVLLAGAAATHAYTLVFKDGSTLVVDDRYRIEDDRLYATLLSGTETFFSLSDVDIDRTDEMNETDLGSAFVLDGRSKRALEQTEDDDPQTLAELLATRGDTTKQGIFSKPKAAARVRTTAGGNLDLFSLPSETYDSAEVTEELTRLFRRHGVTAAIRKGSQDGRLLLQINTNNRGQVFSALTGAAAALVELAEQMPEIQFIELAMSTNNRSRAGMFLMGHEEAVALADGRIEPEAYFFDAVLF